MRASIPAMCTANLSGKPLGLENAAGGYQKISDGEVEYTISDLSVVLENNSLGSGQSEGIYRAGGDPSGGACPVSGNLLPTTSMTLHTEANVCASLLIHPVFFNGLPRENVVLSH